MRLFECEFVEKLGKTMGNAPRVALSPRVPKTFRYTKSTSFSFRFWFSILSHKLSALQCPGFSSVASIWARDIERIFARCVY